MNLPLRLKDKKLKRDALSFHTAIGPILRLVQFFGLLPVQNFSNGDVSSLSFDWKSVQTIYAIILLSLGIFECLLVARSVFFLPINLEYSGKLYKNIW